MRWTAGGVICGCLLGSLPALAHAAELEMRGECADQAELSFRVEQSIGMRLAETVPLSFDVAMARDADGYLARIRVSGASDGERHERVLTATDCSKLVDAVTVAVTLALGMGEPAPLPAFEREPQAPGGPPRAAASGAEIAPASATANDAHGTSAGDSGPDAADQPGAAAWLPSLSLAVLADIGSLPDPGIGAALGASLSFYEFQLQALGTVLFEQQTRIAAPFPAPGARLDLLTGGLLACSALFAGLRAPLTPLLCVGVELGRLSGVGTGVASPRRGSALWAAPLVQLGGSWTIPDTALRLRLALLAATPLSRDEFALQGIGTVHQAPSVVGRLSFGIDLQLD